MHPDGGGGPRAIRLTALTIPPASFDLVDVPTHTCQLAFRLGGDNCFSLVARPGIERPASTRHSARDCAVLHRCGPVSGSAHRVVSQDVRAPFERHHDWRGTFRQGWQTPIDSAGQRSGLPLPLLRWMPALSCSSCPMCGNPDPKTSVGSTEMVCRCKDCGAVWRVARPPEQVASA